ncbi:aminoacyl-histidine dipeptidase [Prevotella sp. CAG:474]|uniref:aminoacyl-histidine dipeptidase n=1 Tax=Prevotella TaxID=838 RepID=UPI00033859D6|nr:MULTISPECIES: aminoacyl-histidine dipeptidase [Prevotella]MCF2635898.1 aminoacyl-histidine dipeptidase [Prevotella dentalis]OYP64632.1 aminoacyl-histidine dipeptidase [Prevotella sp. P5-108]OYP69488.1 aminoacyl-histidine dipeptidase [Prevotella sp. P5-64]CDD01155.1 aminoacyl-histidine dipeptidase [Prevotella sp. CAG:474]
MSNVELKPARVFEQFAKINQIPRPSKREEKMIEYLKEFGKSHGLETVVDETGNVLIRKPATPGHENRKTVILQSHMDMVCDKLVDIEFDFDKDAIQTYVDGEWLRAKGTTLGADDGIGCAIELAVLDSDDIEHGPIECVFTRDEETQLTGAIGMKSGFMNGDYLINLDSEDEGQFFVSCAGGRSTIATFSVEREEAPAGYFFMETAVKGLVGGHSGDDINKKRANAIKLLTRFIYAEMQKTDVRLVSFNSGKLHNAIPRDGKVVFAVPAADKEMVKADFNIFVANVEDEFHVTDTAMEFALTSTDAAAVITKAVGDNIIFALQAVDNGVFAMCQDEALDWLVETSSNVAAVKTTDNEVEVLSSQRSCVMSNLDNMCNTVAAAYRLAGAKVITTDGYPAWKMNPHSKLVDITAETYRKLFGKEPKVLGIHAGLECGLFSERYPNLDMVSFGPTLRYVHTPDERLLIPTVQMVWDHLLEILKNIPE